MTWADVGIGQWGCLGSGGGPDNHIITSAVRSPHSVDAGKLGFGPFHPRSTWRPVSKDGGHYLYPHHILECPGGNISCVLYLSLTVHWACASEVSKCAGVMDSFWGDRPGSRNFRIICSPSCPCFQCESLGKQRELYFWGQLWVLRSWCVVCAEMQCDPLPVPGCIGCSMDGHIGWALPAPPHSPLSVCLCICDSVSVSESFYI